MRTERRRFWVSLVAASVLLAACVTTKFTDVWIDENYQANPDKILVIGISNTPAGRRLFEDEFVKELQNYGTDAVAGYTVLPDQPQADIRAILAKATEIGADTVLITKYIGRRTRTSPSLWATYEDQYMETQTNIYDVQSGKVVWTAASETWITDYKSNKSQIRSFAKVVLKELSKQKVLKTGSVRNQEQR